MISGGVSCGLIILCWRTYIEQWEIQEHWAHERGEKRPFNNVTGHVFQSTAWSGGIIQEKNDKRGASSIVPGGFLWRVSDEIFQEGIRWKGPPSWSKTKFMMLSYRSIVTTSKHLIKWKMLRNIHVACFADLNNNSFLGSIDPCFADLSSGSFLGSIEPRVE